MKFNSRLHHTLTQLLFSLLLLLFLLRAESVSAQVNPLYRPTTDASSSQPNMTDAPSVQPESDSPRININPSRVPSSHVNLRINTTKANKTGSVPSQNTSDVVSGSTYSAFSHEMEEPSFDLPLPLQYGMEHAANVAPSLPLDEANAVSPLYTPEPRPLKRRGVDSPMPVSVTPTPLFKPAEQSQIEEVLQNGALLEKEGRWHEALTLYENAIRTFRKPPVLMQRFRYARFHHDLTRRYNDSSFDMLLRQMSYADTLALYDEVVTKIQLSHIDPPHWNELFENGMHDFEIAMDDPAFHMRHLSNVEPAKAGLLSQKIVRATQNWEIRDSKTLRYAVIAIADTCQKEIGLSPTAVILEFLAGMTNSLDPYTEFMTLNQYNDTNCTISGSFVGLGVELKADRKSLYINRVIPGSPAEKNGLQNLDRILYVDGTSTEGLPLETASNLLQGEAGSSVRLMILSSDNVPREKLICREHLKVPSVENVHILNEYGPGLNIGYFKLIGFQRNTVQEIYEALLYLNRLGMQSLIIDLRGNAGGVLTECIGAADLFLKQGVIVRTKNRGPVPEYVYSATSTSYTWDIPLVVLIDKDSASASEIFAGAIRDNNRGLIVGQPSFGKDTVQAVIPLTGGHPQNTSPIAGLKLTTETYYSPNGTSFSGIGVQPDVLASNTAAYQVNRITNDGENMIPQQTAAVQEDHVLQTAVDNIRRTTSLPPTQQALTPSGRTVSTRYQPAIN